MLSKKQSIGSIAADVADGTVGIFKFLASVRVLKALALGGGLGLLAAKITSPGKRQKQNVSKQLSLATVTDAVERQRIKFLNQYAQQARQRDKQPVKSMRLT